MNLITKHRMKVIQMPVWIAGKHFFHHCMNSFTQHLFQLIWTRLFQGKFRAFLGMDGNIFH